MKITKSLTMVVIAAVSFFTLNYAFAKQGGAD